MTLANRVVVMSKAEVQQVGTPEAIYNDPANLFVAGFVDAPAMNLVEGRLDSGVFSAPGIHLPGFGTHSRDGLVLGVRAEDLPLSSRPEAPPRGEVFSFELTGDATLLTLQAGAHRITAKAGKEQRAGIGQALGFEADAARCFVFDAATQQRWRVPA